MRRERRMSPVVTNCNENEGSQAGPADGGVETWGRADRKVVPFTALRGRAGPDEARLKTCLTNSAMRRQLEIDRRRWLPGRNRGRGVGVTAADWGSKAIAFSGEWYGGQRGFSGSSLRAWRALRTAVLILLSPSTNDVFAQMARRISSRVTRRSRFSARRNRSWRGMRSSLMGRPARRSSKERGSSSKSSNRMVSWGMVHTPGDRQYYVFAGRRQRDDLRGFSGQVKRSGRGNAGCNWKKKRRFGVQGIYRKTSGRLHCGGTALC